MAKKHVGIGIAAVAASAGAATYMKKKAQKKQKKEMVKCRDITFTSWKQWTLPAAHVMGFLTHLEDMSCAAEEKWRIISSACGISFEAFLPWKFQMHPS